MSTILQRAPDETHQQRRLKGFAQRPTPYTARKRISRRPDSEEFFRAFWGTIVRKPNPPFEANYSNVTDPSADPFFAYYLERFGAKRDPVLATRVADVDALAAEAGLDGVDVLKIDTDGYDFDVLCGATRTLSSCVAVEIEVQFQGPVSDDANVFCNIDRLLRKEGFSLFKLAPVHYARSALPRPFLYDIPANNVAGPLAWGDALYVRDVGVAPNDATTKDKLRSLALVLDIYGLEDAAAEILLSHPDLFGPSARALDFLAAKLYGSDISYSDVVTRFCQDPIRSPAR